jgi:threonine dehydratase
VEANSETIMLCKHLVDDWVLVREDEIERALWDITQIEKIIVEGSAALAYAGCLKYLQSHNVSFLY